jgi:predicted metalloendopeptidase
MKIGILIPAIFTAVLQKRNEEYQPIVTSDFPHLLGFSRLQAWMDSSVDPCDDFYQYSCGGFLKRYADFKNLDIMKMMGDANSMLMKNILEQDRDHLAKNTSEKIIFQKAKSYYQSCMDKETIERRGFSPILPVAFRIQEKTLSEEQLPALFGELQAQGVDVLFRSKFSKVETKDPDDLRLQFFPSPAYDVPKDTIRTVLKYFQQHKVIPNKNLSPAVDIVHKLEQANVNFMKRMNLLRHKSAFDKPNQFQTIDSLNAKTGLQWESLVQHIKLGKISKIHLWSGLDPWIEIFTLFGSVDRKDLQHYMLWRLATSHFNKLSSEYRDFWQSSIYVNALKADFPEIDSDGDVFQKDCVEETGKNLRYLSGNLFNKYAFNATQRDNARKMLDGLFEAFRARLLELDWMDQITKRQSLNKLDNIVRIVGYPDWLSDPDTVEKYHKPLVLNPRKYFENAVQAQVFTELMPAIQQSRHETLDRSNIYFGYPWQLNAFHLTDLVLIQINAGILQRPMFSSLNPTAMNYGGLGTVIAHEITHGFDSIGALLDSRGVRRHWMTEKSHHQFFLRSKCFVKEYNELEIKLDDGTTAHANGKKSLPENMADNGGMFTAFRAMRNEVGDDVFEKGDHPFSPAQTFFLSMAQSWCSRRSAAMTRYMLAVDVHSPNPARVHGMVMNSPDFARAFQCKIGSKMRPHPAEQTCRAY